MSKSQAYAFSFTVNGKSEDSFSVVSFRGDEFISRPYRFEILLSADAPDLEPADFIYKDCVLKINGPETERQFNGIVYLFRHIRRAGKKYIYQIVLMPRLQLLTLYTRSRIFLKKSWLEIVKDVLGDFDISPEIRIPSNGSYQKREYTCQFNESDFAFISRWLEAKGIVYFFEQKNGGEQLVLASAKEAQQPCRKNKAAMHYAPSNANKDWGREDLVTTFVSEHGCVPKNVVLKDYYPAKNKPFCFKTHEVDSDVAQGVVWHYGSTQLGDSCDVGQETIVAQQLESAETAFQGQSYCPEISVGRTLQLQDHYRRQYNTEFYVYHVEHKGDDRQHALNGFAASGDNDAEDGQYENTFNAVPADRHYRPSRSTPVPHFTGMLTAFVVSDSGSNYAPINEEGRYKVRLPFDLYEPGKQASTPSRQGKASHWIRLAEPFAGNDKGDQAFGMHFPLREGTEVLLSFVEGDIDRPVIISAVYNAKNRNPVTSGNASRHILRTQAGNRMEIDDDKSNPSIGFATPNMDSLLTISKDGFNVTTKQKAFKTTLNDTFDFGYGSSVKVTVGADFGVFAGIKTSVNLISSTSVNVGMSLGASLGGKLDFNKTYGFVSSDFSGSSEKTLKLQGGMNQVLSSYYNKVKRLMLLTAISTPGTEVGSFLGTTSLDPDNNLSSTGATIAGWAIAGSSALLGTGTFLVGLGRSLHAARKKEKETFYTSTLELDTKGAKLGVCSPITDDSKCELKVYEPISGKESSIVVTKQGQNIQLTNRKDALLHMDDGDTITLAIANAPTMLPIYSQMILTKSKGAELTVNDTGGLDIGDQKVKLEHVSGSGVSLGAQGVELKSDETAESTIKVTPAGIKMKFSGMGKIEGEGALKMNAEGMVMIG